jgi:peptidoglycan/xylan/chitin deacetylase (PgdA/CDA1 family)
MQAPVQPSTQGAERSSYSSVRVDGPYIAMTFDDGPDAKLTPRLLDILKERHIHATFFVLGNMVQSHPEILQREAAEGHEIGNHSWSHLPLTKVVQREGGLHHELADTSDLIKQTIGKPVTLMRPPYGATNPRLSKAIEKEYGMKVILWSVDPDDWKDPGPSVVESRIINGWKQSGGTKPGAIILSHDIHKGTIEAMPATLDALLAKGYKFVTVSELIALESKTPAPSPTPTAAHKPTKTKRKDS